MGKRILYCADGTWDTTRNDASSFDTTNTNVRKMYRASIASAEQIAFYDSGVGTDDRLLPSLRGGAFGAQIDEKIKQAYSQIAQVHKVGDEIFLFGWSRGAYTVRSLASMIYLVGFPTKSFDNSMVDELFFVYRNPEQRETLLDDLDKKYGLRKTPIKFVGVLDTVGSLGLPAVKGGVSEPRYGFLNTSLDPNILNAYQAIAIDECRQQFPITMWDEPSPPVKGQVLEQIWFAGDHEDVGGGFPEDEAGLSEIPLKWMADKASSLGLQIKSDLLTRDTALNAKQALSPIHDEWSPKYGRREYRVVPDNAMLSDTVAFRCKQDNTYRPQNLSFVDDTLAKSYQIKKVLEK